MQITQLEVFPFGMINCFLIKGEKKHVLVDSGVPKSEKKILRQLKALGIKMNELHTLCNQNKFCEPFQPKTNNNLETNYTSSKLFSKLFTSKIHKFENLPEPRNATEGILII